MVWREVPHKEHRIIEANHKGKVALVRDHRFQKLAGSALFKRKSIDYGVAHIDDESDTQGKLSDIVESEDGLRRLVVVANFDVGKAEVGHGLSVIGCGEQHRNLLDLESDNLVGNILVGLLRPRVAL